MTFPAEPAPGPHPNPPPTPFPIGALAAIQHHEMFASYVEAGFTRTEAMTILTVYITAGITLAAQAGLVPGIPATRTPPET